MAHMKIEDLPNFSPLNSSNISGATMHDGHLFVCFTNGSVYKFPGVPQHLYDGLLKTDSPGRFFADHIRSNHKGERVV